MTFLTHTKSTCTAKVVIIIAGSVFAIKDICEKNCPVGCALSIVPATITAAGKTVVGGEITLINREVSIGPFFDRFGEMLATILMERLGQNSCTVISGDTTKWIRKND